MFTNLTTLIIYLFSIENNIKLPIIIPIFLIIRCMINIFFKKSIIYNLTVLQVPLLSNIEYIVSIGVSLLYIYFLNMDKSVYDKNKEKIQNNSKKIIMFTFLIYLILFFINFLYVTKLMK